MAPLVRTTLLACALLATEVALAQATVAYPQNSTQSRVAHVTPFGFDATRLFDECRFQQRVPARYISAGEAQVTALSIAGAVADAPVRYERLQIVIGIASDASGQGGRALDSEFAANFVPGTMQTVLDGLDFDVTLVANAWTRIAFQHPFEYGGTGDLLIEVRKRIDPAAQPVLAPVVGNQLAGQPVRSDLPMPRFVASARDAGAFDSMVATGQLPSPVSLRLEIARAPTLRLQSSPSLWTGNTTSIGSRLTLEVEVPNDPADPAPPFGAPRWSVILMHTEFAAVPLTTPPATGSAWLPFAPVAPWILPTSDGAIFASGVRSTSLWLPWNPALVGFHATFQALVVETEPFSIRWTNATDAIVQP